MVRGRPSRTNLYRRLDEGIIELRERMGGLPNRAEASDIWRDIWFQEAHHSTAIEGNTLVLRQVEALLGEGRAIGQKQLAEYLEVRGYADAAEWVYGQAIETGHWESDSLLTLAEVRHVHELVLSPAWAVAPHPDATDAEAPGSFRHHDIQPFPGGMVPPAWTDIPALVTDWLDLLRQIRPQDENFIELVAQAHCEFERIHPFLDGNGRTGRLLTNLVLVRLGYPPAIIFKNQRPRYLRALQRADQKDVGALAELLARAILDNLYKFVMPAVAGPIRLVPLAALSSKEITVAALRTAAVRNRLQATKGADGQWRSTRKWVDDYTATRYERNN